MGVNTFFDKLLKVEGRYVNFTRKHLPVLHLFIARLFRYAKIKMQSLGQKLVGIVAFCICESVIRLGMMRIGIDVWRTTDDCLFHITTLFPESQPLVQVIDQRISFIKSRNSVSGAIGQHQIISAFVISRLILPYEGCIVVHKLAHLPLHTYYRYIQSDVSLLCILWCFLSTNGGHE